MWRGEEYDDYHKFNGISTPFSTARYHNGDMTNQRFLYNVVYGGRDSAGHVRCGCGSAQAEENKPARLI